MKFCIKAYDKKIKTLYQVQSDDIKIIEDKALLYAAQGLNYRVYREFPDKDCPGLNDYSEIRLTGNGGYDLVW